MSVRPSRAALDLAQRYTLALQRVPPRGATGERAGKASGSSLEFHERRPYQPGDDVRHIDWRALARSDQLVVRLWREELLARVEILIDTSRSMAIDARKAQLAVDLAALVAHGAREDGATVQLLALGAVPRVVELEELAREGLAFEERTPFEASLRAAGGLQRRGAVCVLLSDFLFPHDARTLLRTLSARAGALALVQVLARTESAPASGAARRLVDCESDARLDLLLDRATVARYRARLANLISALADECRRAQAQFHSLVADAELAEIARARLAHGGLLAPR
ncbi:MAG: DUF58 domain-containing protein [Planctomycetes bacterium]|nr:DUF58 domain-containing protein [Planctomycetota bacterium]